jgi:hypothetical protein
MVNSVNQMLDNNKRIYNDLVSNKDRDLKRLAEDLKYAKDMASEDYNRRIDDEKQAMLKSIKALDDT